MARERIPNLILLDMMLPKLDGLGVLRALNHDPQTADIAVNRALGPGSTKRSEAQKGRRSSLLYKINQIRSLRPKFLGLR
jgi:CheY-like chemotaxis protein